MEITKIKELSELKSILDGSASEEITILKFSADWCNPCKTLTRTIEEMEPIEGVKFIEADADECNQELVDEYKVRNLPYLVFFKGNLIVDKATGGVNKVALKAKIDEVKGK